MTDMDADVVMIPLSTKNGHREALRVLVIQSIFSAYIL